MLLDFSEYYHIYNHSNGSENLFLHSGNYAFFLKKAKTENSCRISTDGVLSRVK